MNLLTLLVSLVIAVAIVIGFQLFKAEIVKWFAKSEFLCAEIKENRVIQVDDESKFRQFVLSKAGYRFAFQAKNASIQYQNVSREIPWEHERDKWFIVEDTNFRLENWEGLTTWQKWCLEELGVYWFGGYYFQRKIRYRTINLNKFVTETVKDEKGNDVLDETKKPIFITKLQKIQPDRSKYLYATDTNYAFELLNAEDATGNPVNVQFTAIGTNVNPYISWVENESWDQKQQETALTEALNHVRKHPFMMLNRFVAEHFTLQKKEQLTKEQKQLIVANFCKVLLKALNKLHDGFEYSQVTLRNVDPADPKVRELIRSVMKSEAEKLVLKNKADGQSYAIDKVKGTENKRYKERMQITSQHPAASAISQLTEMFKNMKAFSYNGGMSPGSKDIFTTMFNLDDDLQPLPEETFKSAEEEEEEVVEDPKPSKKKGGKK